jgi:hypothetical protein
MTTTKTPAHLTPRETYETGLTRENVLKHLADLGKQVANFANPQYYRAEERDCAKRWQKPLENLRHAYRKIQAGADITAVLSWLLKPATFPSSIEGNRIARLHEAHTTGYPYFESGWTVEAGDLVFRDWRADPEWKAAQKRKLGMKLAQANSQQAAASVRRRMAELSDEGDGDDKCDTCDRRGCYRH